MIGRPAAPFLAALALAVAAAGCSATRLLYGHADLWLRWKAERYLDLDAAQRTELDARVSEFLAWHRAQALPRYAQLAEDAVVRLERGASRADMVWGYDAARAQVQDGLLHAGMALGDFLDRLSPAQIDHLSARLDEDNRKYEAEWLAGSPAERRERRLKRLERELKDWLGELSDAQRERVRRFNDQAPLNAALRDQERRRLQAELLALLRARRSAVALGDWAAHWDRHRDPAFSASNHATTELFFNMLADLAHDLSAAQRAHVVARLRGYAADFQVLAAR